MESLKKEEQTAKSQSNQAVIGLRNILSEQEEHDLADTNEYFNEFSSLNSSQLNSVRKLRGGLSELKIRKKTGS